MKRCRRLISARATRCTEPKRRARWHRDLFCLTAKGVSSGYGEIPVLRDITLDVKEGETIAILGPNGAGKTTLLRTLAGLNRCTSGTIEFAGRHAEKLPAEERARAWPRSRA